MLDKFLTVEPISHAGHGGAPIKFTNALADVEGTVVAVKIVTDKVGTFLNLFFKLPIHAFGQVD